MFCAGMLVAAIGCNSAHAEVITGNVSFAPVVPPTPGEYRATILQTPTQDIAAVCFNRTSTTLEAVAWVLDEGSDWYLADFGQELSAPTISNGQFVPILTITNGVPGNARPPVTIPQGDFYLAINTGVGTTSLPGGYVLNRDVFGWVKLHNDGTALQYLDSAVAHGEPGIYIGTTTPAPEPASLALLGIGASALLVRRRRRAA
jgi:hypothetical protein